MKKILHINSDPLPEEDSVNKRVCNRFLNKIQNITDEVEIVELDLYEHQPSFFDQTHFDLIWRKNVNKSQLVFDSNQAELSYLASQISLLEDIDTLVISAPVWNFNLPAILKAWIDMVFNPGYCFEFSGNEIKPLHNISKVISIVSAGGYLSKHGTDKAIFHLLHSAFQFIGVCQFDDVLIEGQDTNSYPDFEHRIQSADRRLENLLDQFM